MRLVISTFWLLWRRAVQASRLGTQLKLAPKASPSGTSRAHEQDEVAGREVRDERPTAEGAGPGRSDRRADQAHVDVARVHLDLDPDPDHTVAAGLGALLADPARGRLHGQVVGLGGR